MAAKPRVWEAIALSRSVATAMTTCEDLAGKLAEVVNDTPWQHFEASIPKHHLRESAEELLAKLRKIRKGLKKLMHASWNEAMINEPDQFSPRAEQEAVKKE